MFLARAPSSVRCPHQTADRSIGFNTESRVSVNTDVESDHNYAGAAICYANG